MPLRDNEEHMPHRHRTPPQTLAFTIALSFLLAAAPEPKPFIRDVRVGYLLQYNFLSPRPYCWPGENALLSGWEVDKSGGTWACQPNCHYPDGFAFHSDWFKLVDTSTTAAVTIKHQIARQTKGKLTLEFRFKLPTRMDGAAWQLRDLKDAAISITTAGEDICYDSRNGTVDKDVSRLFGEIGHNLDAIIAAWFIGLKRQRGTCIALTYKKYPGSTLKWSARIRICALDNSRRPASNVAPSPRLPNSRPRSDADRPACSTM